MDSDASDLATMVMQTIIPVAIFIALSLFIRWGIRASQKATRLEEEAELDLPALLGLEEGEALGSTWEGVHTSGAPMTFTITSRDVLALNYTEGTSPAIRIPRQGARIVTAKTVEPLPGTSEPQVQLGISHSHIASFGIIVEPHVASYLVEWAGTA